MRSLLLLLLLVTALGPAIAQRTVPIAEDAVTTTHNLGANGHGILLATTKAPENLGQNGHGQQQHNLGANGHGQQHNECVGVSVRGT